MVSSWSSCRRHAFIAEAQPSHSHTHIAISGTLPHLLSGVGDTSDAGRNSVANIIDSEHNASHSVERGMGALDRCHVTEKVPTGRDSGKGSHDAYKATRTQGSQLPCTLLCPSSALCPSSKRQRPLQAPSHTVRSQRPLSPKSLKSVVHHPLSNCPASAMQMLRRPLGPRHQPTKQLTFSSLLNGDRSTSRSTNFA